jgi:hypothetical protein
MISACFYFIFRVVKKLNMPTFLRLNDPAVKRKLSANFVKDLVISSRPAHHILDLRWDAPSDFVESPDHGHLILQKVLSQRYRGIQPEQ